MEKQKEKIPSRQEIKYLCHETQIPVIQNRVGVFCDLDPHAEKEGRYLVRSLYFDDYWDTAYHENAAGVDPRQKYRIRLYNGDSDRLTLERKSKRSGKTYKETVPIPRETCVEILEGEWFCPDPGSVPLLLRQFYLEYRTKLLRPVVIVEYERIPYLYSAGNVRITFDRNISVSGNTGEFLEESLAARPVMPPGRHILEVKYDALIPDFLYNAVSVEGMRQTTFSKYYLGRKIQEGR